MKAIPPSDFCRWANPDVIEKSTKHRYLIWLEHTGFTWFGHWASEMKMFQYINCDNKSVLCRPDLIMILPNDPEENDTK